MLNSCEGYMGKKKKTPPAEPAGKKPSKKKDIQAMALESVKKFQSKERKGPTRVSV